MSGKVSRAIRNHVNRMVSQNRILKMNAEKYTLKLKKLYLNGGLKITQGELQLVKDGKTSTVKTK